MLETNELLVLVFSLVACAAPPPRQPPLLSVSAGDVQVFDEGETESRLGLELRFEPLDELQLRPSMGVVLVPGEATLVYSELRRDFWLDERWVWTPSFGAGLFREQGGLNLGSELQFRSGLEFAYRFSTNARIGIALYHVSNGGIGNPNPGTEALVLSVSIPL